MQYVKYSVKRLSFMDYSNDNPELVTVREIINIFNDYFKDQDTLRFTCEIVNSNSIFWAEKNKISIDIIDDINSWSNIEVLFSENGVNYKLTTTDRLLYWSIKDREEQLLSKMYINIKDLPNEIVNHLNINKRSFKSVEKKSFLKNVLERRKKHE